MSTRLSLFLWIGISVFYGSEAHSGMPWFSRAGGCWRHISADKPPPRNLVREFQQAMVLVTLPLTEETKTKQCSEARRQALEAAAKWSVRCCYPVETVKRLPKCPSGGEDIVNHDINVEYAMFSFDSANGNPKSFACDPHELDRRKVLLRATCYDAIVKAGCVGK